MRVDLYTAVHKAQRFHLFRLSNEIGSADFTDTDTVQRISAEFDRLLHILRDHAHNEETYIHPLFQQLGQAGEALQGEHQTLEKEIEGLEAILREQRWGELYARYTLFLGHYLLHLDKEEQTQKNVLWQNYADSELAAVFNRFKAERSPQEAKVDLELMLPALSLPELTRMFQGMKASAPESAFQGACGLAAGILGTGRWEQLRRLVFVE